MDITHCLFICLYERKNTIVFQVEGVGGTRHSWWKISPIIYLTEMRYIFLFTLKHGFSIEWSHRTPNPQMHIRPWLTLEPSGAKPWNSAGAEPNSCVDVEKGQRYLPDVSQEAEPPTGHGLGLTGAQWQIISHFNELPVTLHFPDCRSCLTLKI